MTDFQVSSTAQGQAGVHRVAAELMMRGFKVAFPAADDHGVDLVVNHSMRVQVKCSHLRTTSGSWTDQSGAYWFKLARGKVLRRGKAVNRPLRDFSAQCDFVVLWGIEQHRFWIVPASMMDRKQLVVVGPEVGYRQIDCDEMDRLLAAGVSQKEVAQRYGVDEKTISRRKNGMYRHSKQTVSSQVRECEGKWSLLFDHVALMQEANRIVNASSPRGEAVVDRDAFLKS